MKASEFSHFEIEFDLNGKFQGRPVNFDPYADKAVTVGILKKQLADIERHSRNLLQTDRVLRRLAKTKSALETLIESFSDAGTSTVVSDSATPRKDKRIEKKLRRKAARFEQGRK
jgi:hypothetical protein